MPTLPRYNSQRNISPSIAEPLRNEAVQPFQDTAKVVGAMQEVAQKWSDANDVMEYTEAKSAYEVGTADVMARASADPDFKDTKKYYKELADIKANSAKVISNAQVRDKFSMEADYGNQIVAIKIDSGAKTKQLEFNKFNITQNIEGLLQKKLQSDPGSAEAAQYDRQIQEMLAINVATGTLTSEEADKALRESQITGVQYEIYADTATNENDSRVLKELQDSKGEYSYLPSEDRLKLIEDSQRRIFQNNQTLKKATEETRGARYDNILDKLLDDSLTIQDIDNELQVDEAQGGLKKKTLLSIKKGLQTNIKSDIAVITKEKARPGSAKLSGKATKATEYARLIDNFIDDETDAWVAKEKMAEAYADGILNPKEMQFLNSLKKNLKDIEWNRKTGIFKNVIEGVKNKLSVGNPSDQDIALRIKDLLGRLSDGEDPQTASDEVISYQIEKDIQKARAEVGYAGASKLTSNQAMEYLSIDDSGKPVEGGRITVVSSSGKIGQESNQTGLEGVNKATLDVIKNVSSNYDIDVTITGLTEKGHREGSRSHSTGHKADLRLENKLNKIVTSWESTKTRKNKGKTEKGYVDPRSGAIFWREVNHWDIETVAQSSIYTNANIEYTMKQMNMTREEVLRELRITEADVNGN